MTQTASDLPESLAKAAEQHNWPVALVQQALRAGLPADRIEQAIRSGITPQQAMQMMANMRAGGPSGSGVLGNLQQSIGGGPQAAQPDLRWMDVPTERGRLAPIWETGLELAAVEQGTYGIVPDYWHLENDTPRGAYLPPGAGNLPASYTIYKKSEVWADNAALLYEEAIRNHWVSATAIPWDTIQPLPQHTELAIGQVCTTWSEHSHLGLEAVSRWLEEISYGFHEVKLFLATCCFDFGRQTEAFRKRALSNGGGLGVQTPGVLNRAVYSAMKFNEMVAILMVLRGSFQITLWEKYGDLLARSEADRKLIEYSTRDLKRHLEYAIEHFKLFLALEPQRRNQVHAWLNRGEVAMASEWRRNKAYNEALMMLLDEDPRAAKTKLRAIWRRQIEDYEANLARANLREHKVNDILVSQAVETPVGA
jgi:hypothetical protein